MWFELGVGHSGILIDGRERHVPPMDLSGYEMETCGRTSSSSSIADATARFEFIARAARGRRSHHFGRQRLCVRGHCRFHGLQELVCIDRLAEEPVVIYPGYAGRIEIMASGNQYNG